MLDAFNELLSFQSALRFAVVSDEGVFRVVSRVTVSIRFEVRGGFRHGNLGLAVDDEVSIRFEVRGGFRPTWPSLGK